MSYLQKLEYLCQLFGLCYTEESTIGLVYDILCCITGTDSSFDIESVSEYMMSNQLDMLSMLLKENLDHIDVNLILRGDPRHVEMLVDILFELTHAVLASSQNASTRQNLPSRPGAGSFKYQDDTLLKLVNDVHCLDNQRNFVQFNQSHVDRKQQYISNQSVDTKQILINKRSEDMQMVAKDLRRELDSCYKLIDAYVASVQSSYAHKIQTTPSTSTFASVINSAKWTQQSGAEDHVVPDAFFSISRFLSLFKGRRYINAWNFDLRVNRVLQNLGMQFSPAVKISSIVKDENIKKYTTTLNNATEE
ncbi:hypothetical protein MIR68_002363 [Amoeboaphelidium protococcarum]|nr:hypothetical protein MIR68_002363 [Amoeboaphelidium protococcarum]